MRLICRRYCAFEETGLRKPCIEKNKAILLFDIFVKFIDNP
jgi:hypothetical protein